LEASGVLVLERGKLIAALADDELRVGIEAGFQGVLRGDGLAFGSARAGGLLCVEPVGFDLTLGRHWFTHAHGSNENAADWAV
jgi:hypothetical protein